MAPVFLVPLHRQWGNPWWLLRKAGEWREEQQGLPGRQDRAELRPQPKPSLLFPVLCGIHKKKPNSERAKKRMTTQVISGTHTQNIKSLNCSDILRWGPVSLWWYWCKLCHDGIATKCTYIYFCLLLYICMVMLCVEVWNQCVPFGCVCLMCLSCLFDQQSQAWGWVVNWWHLFSPYWLSSNSR